MGQSAGRRLVRPGRSRSPFQLVIEAIYAAPADKAAPLRRINLNLEKLRVFWRLVHDRHWISQQQLLFASQQLDEIGRMAGGWLNSLTRD